MFAPGLESFFNAQHSSGIKIGAVVNATSKDSQGRHLLQRLQEDGRFILSRVFTPEHGFYSDAPDGSPVDSFFDPVLGVEIVSLYGKNKKPSPAQLKDIDLLIYDIQDAGVRFYTYISTLKNVLEAANESDIPAAVLDRPDLLGGEIVEGPIRHENLKSFVSALPIPVRYGMTPGELALWWSEKNNLNKPAVYKCQDYICPSAFESLNFPWFKPSPSLKDTDTAKFYPGTCLFEGTNISEGRGTIAPFRIIGAPNINSGKWIKELKALIPENIKVEEIVFTPTFSKFVGKKCNGIKLSALSTFLNNAFYVGVAAVYSLILSHPGLVKFETRPNLSHPFIDYLTGASNIREYLEKGLMPPYELLKPKATSAFEEERKEFYLYKRE